MVATVQTESFETMRTGIRNRITVLTWRQKKGPLSEVVITIRAQTPCWEDLVAVYRAMQRKRGTRKKASLFDKRDLEVLEAVQALGGPPEGVECSKQFWEKVRRRLRSREGINYGTWRAPMMRFSAHRVTTGCHYNRNCVRRFFCAPSS